MSPPWWEGHSSVYEHDTCDTRLCSPPVEVSTDELLWLLITVGVEGGMYGIEMTIYLLQPW